MKPVSAAAAVADVAKPDHRRRMAGFAAAHVLVVGLLYGVASWAGDGLVPPTLALDRSPSASAEATQRLALVRPVAEPEPSADAGVPAYRSVDAAARFQVELDGPHAR